MNLIVALPSFLTLEILNTLFFFFTSDPLLAKVIYTCLYILGNKPLIEAAGMWNLTEVKYNIHFLPFIWPESRFEINCISIKIGQVTS